MKPKNTCLLVLLAGGLFAFIHYVEPGLRKPLPPPVRVVPNLQPAEINQVELMLAGQPEIHVIRTNGSWLITKPLVYLARSEAVENLLQAAAGLSPQVYISAADLKGRLTMNAEYGFDNPKAAIVFGGHPKLNLGFFTAPGDQMYAQLVGLEGVDIVDAEFFNKFIPRQVNDWRDTSFIHFVEQDFDRLTVAAGSQTFTLQHNGSNDLWRMTMPVRTRADYPKIDLLLIKLQRLEVTRFETDDERADLEAYGFKPAGLELAFDQGTNHLFTLQFGKSPTNDDTHIYARRVGQNAIVLVPREPVAGWLGGFQEFRDHRLTRMLSVFPDIIEVAGAEKFTLQRQTNDLWRVTSPQDFPADTNVMSNFLRNLAVLEVAPTNGAVAVNDAVLSDVELPGYGLAPPARSYLLKRFPKNLPPGVTNVVMAQLDFGLEKDGRVFARRADHPDETSVYAVKSADYQKLPGTSLQFRPHRIWEFTEDDVIRINIRQLGQVRKLFHKGAGQWGIESGSGLINELQTEIAAQELGLLEAADWVQRGDADRARFGFTDKSLQLAVEVRLDGKPQTLTLDIAEPSPRGTSPHGLRFGDVRMADGENWIFEVPAVVLDRLTTYLNIHENTVP